jgi:hypothetical protein
MAKLADLAGPMMSAWAGFHRDKTRRLGREEAQNLLAPQLLTKDRRAGGIRAVGLKDVLGQIQADGANFRHGRSPVVALKHHHLGTSMPSGGVHPIIGRRRPSPEPCAWAA